MVAEYSQEHKKFKTNKKQMKFILRWYSALIRTDDYEELFYSLKKFSFCWDFFWLIKIVVLIKEFSKELTLHSSFYWLNSQEIVIIRDFVPFIDDDNN